MAEEPQEEQHSSGGINWLVVIGIIVAGIVALVVIGIIIWQIYIHTKKSSPLQTTVATSAGTRADGSNSMSTYGGAGTFVTARPNPIGCTLVYNSNYVPYKIYNGSGNTQNFAVVNTYPQMTQCSTGASTYFTPNFVNPGATLLWSDNTVNGTAFSFYYDSLIEFTNTLGTSTIGYYPIGNPGNTTNPIDGNTQYLLINYTSTGGINISVADNGT